MHKSSYKMGGIGALYELCAPSATPHSSLLIHVSRDNGIKKNHTIKKGNVK